VLVAAWHASVGAPMSAAALSPLSAYAPARMDPTQPRKPALEIRSVRKVFDHLEAIRDIWLGVADGEFAACSVPAAAARVPC